MKPIAGSYSGYTPIYITENGMASDDAVVNGEVGAGFALISPIAYRRAANNDVL